MVFPPIRLELLFDSTLLFAVKGLRNDEVASDKLKLGLNWE